MRIALISSVLVLLQAACIVQPGNPFDPETPAEQQAKAQLSGAVSGSAGLLEGATVTLGELEVTTGEDGAYSFELEPGDYTLSVGHPAHLRQVIALSLVAGQARVLDFTLDALPEVAGDEVGRLFGVAHRSGQLALPEAEQDHSGIVVEVEGTGVRAVTNLAGDFDLFLLAGTYDLSLATAGHVELVLTDVIVAAEAETEVPGSPFVLQGVPGSVSGVARLEDGASADGIAVDLAGGGSATTDATGAFTVGDVPAGTYLLTLTKDGYEPLSFGFVSVVAARTTVLPDLVLAVSRGAVIGNALLAGQQDHSGVIVQLAGGGGAAVTGADGAFRIDGVREGTYSLSAQSDGFVTTNLAGVEVVANTETDVGSLTLAPQQGDFQINSGAVFTTDPAVTLELEGEGAVEMRISEDQTFTDAGLGDVGFVTFAQSPAFTLSAGDGLKTLFAELRDGDGVVSPLLSAQITLDTTPPTVSFVINGDSPFTRSLAVSLSVQANDPTSGVGFLQISEDAVLDEPFNNFAANPSFNLNAATVDGTITLRVAVRDFAGNVSAVATDDITLDRVAPTQTAFSIDCGGVTDAAFCASPIVSLHVESPDAVAMALSNDAGLDGTSIFQAFSEDVTHLLAPGEGSRSVFLMLRDAAGNLSAEFNDTITVDSIPPLSPSVSIAGGAAAVNDQTVTVDLGATGATLMRIAFDGVLDTEPAVAFAAQASGDLPAGDGTKTVVAVFLDDAGNLSATVSDTVVLDETAPVLNSLRIDGGALFSNDAGGAVTLSLQASDATSGVVDMQVSNDAVFNEAFEAFTGTRAHVLDAPGVDAQKTVNVQVRDLAGNLSAPVAATITLDRAPPTLTSFTIDCDGVTDATFCTSSVVSLSVASPDAVTMALSNQAGLPGANFVGFAADLAHLLTPGEGARSVFLLLRDAAGNVSAEFSDDITVDTLPPAFPSVSIRGGAFTSSETVTVDLAASGATRMRVAFDGVLDTEPTVAFTPVLTDDVPAGDGAKSVVAVFLDDAGNESAAASASVTLDTIAPANPSIVIDDGAAFTSTISVTLTLAAQGASEMRVRTAGAFTNEPFVPVAASTVALLPPGDCAGNDADCKTACVVFRDAAGNLSAEACDDITLDGAPPAVPVITTPSQVVSAAALNVALAGEPADAFFGGYELLVDPGDNGVFAVVVPGVGPSFDVNLTPPVAADPQLASTPNLVRIRAFDQAGNRSTEATLAVSVDPVAPATPVANVASADVNADNFAVFFDATNTSNLDANFSHYEFARTTVAQPTPNFLPTALQDGIIFTLEQGNDLGCTSPCVNTLHLRAVDFAGNTSGEALVIVDEDSTLPTKPRFTPRGARVTGLEARMRLEEISQDNGGEAPLYEVVGADVPAFEERAAAETFNFVLDRRDFTHEICVRGKDLAGNVSTPDCVSIEQLSSRFVAADGIDETRPTIFGDLIVFDHDADGVVAHELRTGVSAVLDAAGSVPRADGVSNEARVVYQSLAGTRLALYSIDTLGADVLGTSAADPSACVKTCAPTLSNNFSADISGDDIVIFGEDGSGNGIFHNVVSDCRNELAPCSEGTPVAPTRLTDVGRNIQECQGRENVGPRIADGVIVWCEDVGGTQELHRFILPAGPDEVIADTLIEGPESPHQPVVTSESIFWASSDQLCRIDARATVATPFAGCPAGPRVVDEEVSQLWGADGDRASFTGGQAGQFALNANIYDADEDTNVQLTDNIFEQTFIEAWSDRVVYADRSRFSEDIVVRELTEGTWVVAEPNIQAAPRATGQFVVWADTREGIGLFAFDLVNNVEFRVTPVAETITTGDSLFAVGGGKVMYGIVRPGGSELFIQDLTSGARTSLATSTGFFEGTALTDDGLRGAWHDPVKTRLETTTFVGIVPGAISDIGAPVTRVRRLSMARDTVVYADQIGGGNSPVSCAVAGTLTSNELEPDGREATVADVPSIGLIAAWGGNDDQIQGCLLDCVAFSCSVGTLAGNGGGRVEGPRAAASGFITWVSNTASDGFGQIAVYDVLLDRRFKIASDFGVDGDAPVFDPYIDGTRIVWGGFALGTSDVFTAVLGE